MEKELIEKELIEFVIKLNEGLIDSLKERNSKKSDHNLRLYYDGYIDGLNASMQYIKKLLKEEGK